MAEHEPKLSWWGVCPACHREVSNEGESHAPECPVRLSNRPVRLTFTAEEARTLMGDLAWWASHHEREFQRLWEDEDPRADAHQEAATRLDDFYQRLTQAIRHAGHDPYPPE